MNTLPIVLVASATWISTAVSDDHLFLERTVKAPPGWTIVEPDAFACHGSPVKETLLLRNDAGTAWIIAQALRKDFSSLLIGKRGESIESGKVSGEAYTIYALPADERNPKSRFFYFEGWNMAISFLFTTKGSQNADEAKRLWTPPTEAEYESYFKPAKAAVFALLAGAQVAPSPKAD